MIAAMVRVLRDRGIVDCDDEASVVPVDLGEGKVAYRIQRPDGDLFVKRTYPHWWRIEAAIQRLVAARCPGFALPVLHEFPEIHAFAMPHLVSGETACLSDMAPDDDASTRVLAAAVGSRLGEFHARTAGDAVLADVTASNRDRVIEIHNASFQLCAAFRATLRTVVDDTIAETFDRRHALAHGDAGHRNLVIVPDRIVLIDFENAWFGDPAFDAGWLLGSLVSTALSKRQNPSRAMLPAQLRHAGEGWLAHVGWEPRNRAETRAVRIALMRCIARHQNLVQRGARPPPAWRVAEIEPLADLLAQGDADVNALADAVGSLRRD